MATLDAPANAADPAALHALNTALGYALSAEAAERGRSSHRAAAHDYWSAACTLEQFLGSNCRATTRDADGEELSLVQAQRIVQRVGIYTRKYRSLSSASDAAAEAPEFTLGVTDRALLLSNQLDDCIVSRTRRSCSLLYSIALSTRTGVLLDEALFVPSRIWTQDGARLTGMPLKREALGALVACLSQFSASLLPGRLVPADAFMRETAELSNKCRDVTALLAVLRTSASTTAKGGASAAPSSTQGAAGVNMLRESLRHGEKRASSFAASAAAEPLGGDRGAGATGSGSFDAFDDTLDELDDEEEEEGEGLDNNPNLEMRTSSAGEQLHPAPIQIQPIAPKTIASPLSAAVHTNEHTAAAPPQQQHVASAKPTGMLAALASRWMQGGGQKQQPQLLTTPPLSAAGLPPKAPGAPLISPPTSVSSTEASPPAAAAPRPPASTVLAAGSGAPNSGAPAGSDGGDDDAEEAPDAGAAVGGRWSSMRNTVRGLVARTAASAAVALSIAPTSVAAVSAAELASYVAVIREVGALAGLLEDWLRAAALGEVLTSIRAQGSLESPSTDASVSAASDAAPLRPGQGAFARLAGVRGRAPASSCVWEEHCAYLVALPAVRRALWDVQAALAQGVAGALLEDVKQLLLRHVSKSSDALRRAG